MDEPEAKENHFNFRCGTSDRIPGLPATALTQHPSPQIRSSPNGTCKALVHPEVWTPTGRNRTHAPHWHQPSTGGRCKREGGVSLVQPLLTADAIAVATKGA